MATPVIMPKFGMAQEEGTIIRWLKREGEQVKKGEVILEVLTDKIDMEVEAPATGILRDIRYGVDETVPVTTVIASIAAPGEEARIAQAAPPKPAEPADAPGPARARISPVAQRMAAAEGVAWDAVQGSGAQGRIISADIARALPADAGDAARDVGVRATPAARRLARERGIALHEIAGSGPNGRVQAADVEAAPALSSAPPSPVAPAAQLGAPLKGMRRTIAGRLAQSWHDAPHIFLTSSVEMSAALALRDALAAETDKLGTRLTINTILAYGCAAALARKPRLNGWLRHHEGELYFSAQAQVNLGIAVALDDGLIVPVLHNAAHWGHAAFAQQMDTLTTRARSGSLSPADVADATFTISNLGMYPIDNFTALINPPQVAILAVGRMQMQPVWDGAAFAPRPLVELTLSADHRAVDGADAAQFLAEVKQILEEPRRLLL